MIGVLDITPSQERELRSLLRRHVPGVTVWAYGSRVKGTARPASDLDLVVFTPPDRHDDVCALRQAFENSNLPFRVDLFVWDEVPEEFRNTMREEHVVVQEDGDEASNHQSLEPTR